MCCRVSYGGALLQVLTCRPCSGLPLQWWSSKIVRALASGLITDRYGVPQYNGEPELFEEYEERAYGTSSTAEKAKMGFRSPRQLI